MGTRGGTFRKRQKKSKAGAFFNTPPRETNKFCGMFIAEKSMGLLKNDSQAWNASHNHKIR